MSKLFKSFFFIADILLLNLAILGAFYFHDNSIWLNDRFGFTYLLIYSNLAWLFLVMVSAPYKLSKEWSVAKILRNQFSFLFIHLLVIISLVIFFNKNYGFYQIVLIYIFFTPVFFGYRLLVYYLRKLTTGDIKYYNFLLVGRNALSKELRKFYLMNPDLGYRFNGYVDFENNDMPLERISRICSSKDIHEILCCVPTVKEEELNQLIQFGLNSLIKVKLIFQSDNENQSIRLDRYDHVSAIDIATLPLDEFRNQFIKRAFDLAVSIIFLVLVFSWLYPLLAILIKVDSKGPVFFIQLRNGLKNHPFGCYKFRTMSFERDAEFKQAVKNDPRITKVGKFLRKSSFDELPQFINVFKGEMSLIGPRPHPLKLNEEFAEKIATLTSRHYVKPGLSGLAQCMGYRGETQTLADMENRVRLDRYYIENWTFWLDIKIIFLTVVSLIRGSDKAF